jgi:radical SAM superfamily enzyme YgiQ (UPF0313 family)
VKSSTGKKRKIYLVNPGNPHNFWAMKSSVKAMGAKTQMPNIALATLAALTPDDVDIEYHYCDENVAPVKFRRNYDLVAITGYRLHGDRIREISSRFRSMGIPVALGGPFATLFPEMAREMADYLFLGEAEYTWPRFLREWTGGEANDLYEQKEFVDMKDSPVPDWSLVREKDYLYYCVQTSRGCPHNCDFCDIHRLLGRRYRTKTIEQVVAELKNAHRAGAETVFFSEDNFFVNRNYTIELLNAIIEWNTSLERPLSFSTQATIAVGKDEEILKLLADARFSVVFLGVETVRKKCLDEINKGHLFKYNPYESVSAISRYGILPFIGLIVGFDNDDLNTFDELHDFLRVTASPIASISILNAPENTALHERIKKQGRLIEEYKGIWHFSTNIEPVAMTMEELLTNHQKLFRELYDPENFEERTMQWITNISYISDLYINSKFNFSKLQKFFFIMKFYLFHEPKSVRQMFFRILKKTWKLNPRLIRRAITVFSQYCHFYDFSHRETHN